MYDRSRRNNTLFWDGDLYTTLKNYLRSAEDKVNSIPKEQFLATPIDDLVEHISNQLYVEPLQLYEDSREMNQQEIQIDVSHNKHRNTFGVGGPIFVSGIKVTISIPYSGDPTP